MKRMHVHVSVDNLDRSIKFYSSMFGVEPTILKPDYAKWMLEDPRMNFAISHRGAAIGLNHFGIQVESSDELSAMHERLQHIEPEVELESNTACCYAKSDKYWVNDPSGIPWETYHTLDSIPVFGEATKTKVEACCVPKAVEAPKASCCAPKTDRTSNCC